ncbi:hypothetical protein RIF29_18381 [Crotalaria pallida]|uniref:Uncharacterized protein n=1 Tax=Crotalaria pallida TaxID=3830 RepID=A0AAN9FPT3_CROPI
MKNVKGSCETTLWPRNGKIQNEYYAKKTSLNLKYGCKVIEGDSTCEEYAGKYVENTTAGQSFGNRLEVQVPQSFSNSLKDGLVAFIQFIRPISAMGVVLQTTSMSLLAVDKLSDLSQVFFKGWLQGMVAFVFMHIVNIGINQLCDIEIDKINKPYLPLASGKLPFKIGVIIVASSSILGLWFSWSIGSWPLFWTLFINQVLAAAYSVDLPLLRWKKSTILTAANFVANMGVTIPVGYFLHMQDIPDMEGDEKFGIRSLSSRLGQKRVFSICTSLMNMAYGIAILVGVTSPFMWSRISMGLGHAILALALWYRAKSVDLNNNASSQSFYIFIWKLFCAECFLLPLFR